MRISDWSSDVCSSDLLHARIDALDRSNSLSEREYRLVDHRAEDPVDDESGSILGIERRLSDALHELGGQRRRLVGGSESANNLDKRHHRDRKSTRLNSSH